MLVQLLASVRSAAADLLLFGGVITALEMLLPQSRYSILSRIRGICLSDSSRIFIQFTLDEARHRSIHFIKRQRLVQGTTVVSVYWVSRGPHNCGFDWRLLLLLFPPPATCFAISLALPRCPSLNRGAERI